MKRQVFEEMMDSVRRGHSFTIHDRAGNPMAMVMPWASWSNINRRLTDLDEVENTFERELRQRVIDLEEELAWTTSGPGK